MYSLLRVVPATRDLQVSTLANEEIKDNNNETAYIIPYIIGGLATVGILSLLLQYSHYWICKHMCGREDPIDLAEMVQQLTNAQRELVLKQALKVPQEVQNTGTEKETIQKSANEPKRETKEDLFKNNTSETSTTSDHEDIESPEDDDCPICIAHLNDNVFQPQACSHRFHSGCLYEWLKQQKNNMCPVCRAEAVSPEEMNQATLHLFKTYEGWDELGQTHTAE